MHSDVVHSTALLLAESTIPRAGLDLDGSLEQEFCEGAIELNFNLGAELGFEIADALVED